MADLYIKIPTVRNASLSILMILRCYCSSQLFVWPRTKLIHGGCDVPGFPASWTERAHYLHGRSSSG